MRVKTFMNAFHGCSQSTKVIIVVTLIASCNAFAQVLLLNQLQIEYLTKWAAYVLTSMFAMNFLWITTMHVALIHAISCSSCESMLCRKILTIGNIIKSSKIEDRLMNCTAFIISSAGMTASMLYILEIAYSLGRHLAPLDWSALWGSNSNGNALEWALVNGLKPLLPLLAFLHAVVAGLFVGLLWGKDWKDFCGKEDGWLGGSSMTKKLLGGRLVAVEKGMVSGKSEE